MLHEREARKPCRHGRAAEGCNTGHRGGGLRHGKATAAIPPAATCRYGTAAPQRPSTAPARVQEPARYPGGGRASAAPTSSPAGYVGAHATLSEPCTAAAAS